MTSETFDKLPIIVSVNNRTKISWSGVIIILSTWIYLYFYVFASVYEGFLEFYSGFGYTIIHSSLYHLTTKAISVPATEEIVFGSGKYYALCGLSGILSCGITHTAIVPLDLVKCRIQVFLKYFR